MASHLGILPIQRHHHRVSSLQDGHVVLWKGALLDSIIADAVEHPGCRASRFTVLTVLGQDRDSSQAARQDLERKRVLKHGDTFALFDHYGDIKPVGLEEEGVYVLTGPVAGNVHALERWLAREYRARLLLLRPAGDPADEATFEERRQGLVELGGQARVVSLDLADEEALYRALAAARQEWGALDGVVHAAGTVGERTFRVLKETGREEAGWHFAPKVAATLALDRTLERVLGDPGANGSLDFAVLLSSLATVVGGLAYGAYTAANFYLDAFARKHRSEGGAVPWRSVGWDVWQFEDEREQITEMRGDLADLAMSPREGEAAFETALGRTNALPVSA